MLCSIVNCHTFSTDYSPYRKNPETRDGFLAISLGVSVSSLVILTISSPLAATGGGVLSLWPLDTFERQYYNFL
jgi:hypothetical protein